MADFTYICHSVVPATITWNTLLTEMEGMKKKSRLISTRSKQSWKLEFRLLTKAERDYILGHYNGQKGSTIPFNWTSVPDYIDTAASYYVRYTEYVETLTAILFNISIGFEEAL
jgi:hypothetical protein